MLKGEPAGRRPTALWAIIFVSAALLLAGGCQRFTGQGASPTDLPLRPTGQPGGTWVEAFNDEPQSLDPAFAVTLVESRLAALLFNGLTAITPAGQIVPDLAESWQIADDGLTYTFTLRDHAVFHTGRPVTATDVAFSFHRLLDPALASPRAWVLLPIAGARAYHQGLAPEIAGLEVLDDYRLRLTLERPMAQFIHRLTMPAVGILDKEAVTDFQQPLAGEADQINVGTGPFRLEAWTPGREIQLAANEDYHWGAPYLQRLRFKFMQDRSAIVAAFHRGELHGARLSPDELRYLTDELDWTGSLQKVNLPAVYYLAFNNEASPLDDLLVRRALHHAIHRQQLLQRRLPRGYRLAQGAIPPGLPGHQPDRALPAYDPHQARQLLAQAGLDGGFTLTVWQSSGGAFQALYEDLAAMLAEVGVKVALKTVGRREFFDQVAGGGEAQAYILAWYADYADGENFLYPLFHSENRGKGGNRARYAAPETDLLLMEMHAEDKEERRHQLYRQAEDAIFKAVPWVPLFHPVAYYVTQPTVKNYRPSPYYQGQRLWSVWLADS